MNRIFFLSVMFFFHINLFSQSYKIIQSTPEKIIIEFDFRNSYRIIDTLINGTLFNYIASSEFFYRNYGEPWIPEFVVSLGIPRNSNPYVKLLSADKTNFENKFIIPFPDSDPNYFEQDFSNANVEIYNSNDYFPKNVATFSDSYFMRFARIMQLSVSPFQFNPVTRNLTFNRIVLLEIWYNDTNQYSEPIKDGFTEEFLKNAVINYDQAKNWITKEDSRRLFSDNYWYNPNKEYYKIYLSEKGVYRLTYDYLLGLGLPLDGTMVDKIELFNDGIELPIFVKDSNENDIFDSGDYIEFIGNQVSPSPYSNLNIYNLQNVYWLSFEADSVGRRFTSIDGNSLTWDKTYLTTKFSSHFEKDSLYERLGHAIDDKRDYWYWGKTSGQNGNLTRLFTAEFRSPLNLNADSTYFKVRVGMHGLTTISCVNPDHRVKFYLTGQYIGETTWDGANNHIFETTLSIGQINIFPFNNFQVAAYGDIPPNPCNPNSPSYDEILVNWFSIEYYRDHKADSNYFYFYSPTSINSKLRFGVFNWNRDNMRIYIPQKNSVIMNPVFANDIYKTVLFTDSINQLQEYFCVAEDYSRLPDSIIKNSSSDLRNISNGADYIMIVYPDFLPAAEKLKNFRQEFFPDTTILNPRIKVIKTDEIYNEFSNGLLDPLAIKEFLKYTFFNWESPPPSYVVLLGDMSYDYRSLSPQSRKNYIPSMPFHSFTYGQAASDNNFVAVVGSDIIPDMAIGRLSFENLEEADVLINKLINYPADIGKEWKQNVLLISSGLDANDESVFGFNDANMTLDSVYLKPMGIATRKVFRYPNKPSHLPFQGEGPQIRNGFNQGTVFANYYGHGGGYQWDLVFNNDDIYQLQNEGRLPFISSVTCYTAHFDNQDVFGEQFNKVPGKGSIGFFGSSGLTYWQIGKDLNQRLFDQIFIKQNTVVGKAIHNVKSQTTGIGSYGTQIALLTLLGDPLLQLAIPDKPDFQIRSTDISINPINPVVGDTISIKIKVRNFGIIFPNDSVTVQVFINHSDTSYYLENIRRPSFGENDSIVFFWLPDRGGLYNIRAAINLVDQIPEMDFTDNEASSSFPVFDLSTPNIISPIDGFVSDTSIVNFLIADNGYFLSVELNYLIEIDTVISFNHPIVSSQLLSPQNGILSWNSPALPNGAYYWRSRIISDNDSSNWTTPTAFRIDPSNLKNGYYISGKHLKTFDNMNVIYSDSLESLILNTSVLPPKPSNKTFIEDINFSLPQDLHSITSFTNDGTYIYFGHMAFFAGPTKIYKMGTGYNGTEKGFIYGVIPNLEVPIWHQMFFYGQDIYVPTGNPNFLLKINPENGDTSSVYISDGLLNSIDATVREGAFYLSSDGRYVYNVAYIKENGDQRYTVRVFDPENNWQKINDLTPSDRSYPNFCGFFVAKGYFYPFENFNQGNMRRINLETGEYEEEWISFFPFQGFYSWSYDWMNDVVYSAVFSPTFTPKISKFYGSYQDALGSTSTAIVGPASKWNKIEYNIDSENSVGIYKVLLEGFNRLNRSWDTLSLELPPVYFPEIDAEVYNYLKLHFEFADSSLGQTEPIKFKSVNVDYNTLPEIIITKNHIEFSADTIMQGYDVYLTVGVRNLTNADAQNLKLDYYLLASGIILNDSVLFSKTIDVPGLSTISLKDTLITDKLIFDNDIKVFALYPKSELYTFNNVSENSFFVARDTVKPIFSITFDGKEIINGDIISAEPTIVITLEDNSPLPITPEHFTLVHQNVPLRFGTNPDLSFSYTPGEPLSRAEVVWTPTLANGRHTLEVLAKDSSGNFFDSTSNRSIFFVFTDADIRNVYNYPNPFKDDTYFTFELLGTYVPEELRIKIYTVAGRLIREIDVPQSSMQIGFNRLYWDGRDEDGDEIANGLYFYKVISKQEGEIRTITQKLAKLK